VLTELEAAGIAVPFLDGKGDGEQDIQISYTDIASVIEDDKIMKVLRPYLKRTVGGMSQAEQEEAQSARESVSAVEINALIEDATRDQQVKSQADAIHAEVMKGIVGTGRQGPATARYSAETITAYVTAKVDELQREKGVTLSPREVYNMFGLKVAKMTGAPDPNGVQQVDEAEELLATKPLSEIELTDEFEGDDGEPVTVTMTADKALEDIDTRMDNAKKLTACLRK
jgi:hypothetical protein